MAARKSQLARKQEDVIVALLTHRTIEDAARATGIGGRTLLRWLKLPDFQKAYREAKRAAFGQSTARLQQAAGLAASTLLKIMVDPSTPASTRVRAAESILNYSAKGIETEEVEARIAELERVAAEKGD